MCFTIQARLTRRTVSFSIGDRLAPRTEFGPSFFDFLLFVLSFFLFVSYQSFFSCLHDCTPSQRECFAAVRYPRFSCWVGIFWKLQRPSFPCSIVHPLQQTSRAGFDGSSSITYTLLIMKVRTHETPIRPSSEPRRSFRDHFRQSRCSSQVLRKFSRDVLRKSETEVCEEAHKRAKRFSAIPFPSLYDVVNFANSVYGQAAVTHRFPSDHRSQAPSSGVTCSTWMGDHPGTPVLVGNTWCTTCRHMAKPRPQVGRVCLSSGCNSPRNS